VQLALRGYPGALFASDIREGPLTAARRSAQEADVLDRIHFLLCDGLSLCPPEKIDTIVIAGMGGDLIVKILDEAEWCMDARYRLILQPMTKAEVLRYWLINNGFAIHSETIVEDGALLYQIITTGFGGKTVLNDAELFVGKRSLCESEALYERQFVRFSMRMDKACRGMCAGKEGARLRLYQEILRQLNDMRGTP
jgi:tRNA (adenine22-N1)-methyltransferase